MKPMFDITVAFLGLIILSPIIFVSWLMAAISTKSNGIFMQNRVGRNGKLFRVIKLQTMKNTLVEATTVTTVNDSRITRIGAQLRKWKLDELPQLINILMGDMSFVGPRPDVPGFADQLEGEDRIILSLLPGITGPAQLHFRDEEVKLAQESDPEKYNREVVWPKKVELNKQYVHDRNMLKDLRYIIHTIIP